MKFGVTITPKGLHNNKTIEFDYVEYRNLKMGQLVYAYADDGRFIDEFWNCSSLFDYQWELLEGEIKI
jgi:hypothetical protein